MVVVNVRSYVSIYGVLVLYRGSDDINQAGIHHTPNIWSYENPRLLGHGEVWLGEDRLDMDKEQDPFDLLIYYRI